MEVQELIDNKIMRSISQRLNTVITANIFLKMNDWHAHSLNHDQIGKYFIFYTMALLSQGKHVYKFNMS